MEKKMVYAFTEDRRLPIIVQMHENITRNITGTINKGSTVPETHHTSISPIVHSVNQGLEVKTEHGDFDMEDAPNFLVGYCGNCHYRELISPGMSIPLYRGMLFIGGSQDQMMLVTMLWEILTDVV